MKDFFDTLISGTEYSTEETSWSPFYSSAGIGAGKDIKGTGTLWFHYNRRTRAVFDRLISFDLPLNAEKTDAAALCWGENTALYCTACNTFVFESRELPSVSLFAGKTVSTVEFWHGGNVKGNEIFRGYSRTNEARDPDSEVPFAIALKTVNGSFNSDGHTVTSVNGSIRFAFTISILDISLDEMLLLTQRASSVSDEEILYESRRFWKTISDRFTHNYTDDERAILAGSIRALVFNTTCGEGLLSHHLSCYPNRGTYPTHYLWDTCFQNLGYREIDKHASVDFLLQIADNMREDGKIPQFMCSTWGRPEDSQPALLGWAVNNALEDTESAETLSVLCDALTKNIRWWLNARITPCGLVWSPSGLETGQDNSPRFDSGATIPCDMNAYLLNQMKVASDVCGILGKKKESAEFSELAKSFSEKMYKNLYCKEDGLFYDVSRKTGEFIKVRSNACVLPVWAGVDMPADEEKNIIENFLLNENAMYGEIPFPSVAYDDPAYESGNWWRGPTWMPIAYLLAETLKNHGYEKEYKTAVSRLYSVLLKDPAQHELFDSKTGEGLGSAQQGWTSGIFIRLVQDKYD